MTLFAIQPDLRVIPDGVPAVCDGRHPVLAGATVVMATLP